jgi:peptidoglycan/LPS O-acetylase OafA/YrhL
LLPGQGQLASEELRPGGEPDGSYQRRRFLALDGLRGVAVLLVVLAHGTQVHGSQERLLPETLKFNGGWIGVVIFFVLSGFLITHLLLEERTRTGQISLSKFYVRRALRIWPLYFAVLGVYVFVLPLFDPDNFGSIYNANSLRDYYYLLAYPFFLQNYLVNDSDVHFWGIEVFWSLAVEEHFYLFWPLLLVALSGRWLVPSLVGIMVVTFSLRVLTRLEVLPPGDDGVQQMTHTALDGLAAGCLVACLYHWRPAVFTALARRRWLYLLGWALLFFLVWAGLKQLPLVPTLPEEGYYRITLAALGSTLIVACVVGGAGPTTRPILCSRPLTYIGKVSYGMYVLHPIVLLYVAEVVAYLGLLSGAGYFVAITAYCAIVIGVAGLSFKFFEAPILRFKERFARV